MSSQMDSKFDDGDWYNGSIKSIKLENFMCHSNFHLTLNPRINFVSGLNGSGKSAIQTALVVGFGARASVTNRASSLKSLIRYGCSSAIISITIANGGVSMCGSSPYKPEVYGKQITIVRQITESGNPYKFFNESGHVVKSKKNELKNLIIHFNILVSNPICVMNQAMVKTFHKSANPKDKYDLFFQAISADVYNESIEETKLIAKEYSDKLENMYSVLSQCHKEVKEFEVYEKKSKLLETLKNKRKEFENELTWFVVSQHENNFKKYVKKIEEHKISISEGSDQITIMEDKLKTSSELLAVKKEELATIEDSRSRNHFVLMETKKELQKKMYECDTVKQAAKKHDYALQLLIRDRKDLEKHIEIEHKKGNTNTLAQYKEKLAHHEKFITEVDAAWKANMEHEKVLQNTVDDLKQKVSNLKNNEVSPLQRRIVELDRNIQSMSNQQDRINFYGNWMPTLVESIENAFKHNKFFKKPIGPIGEHIKVNNDKWIFSVENHLGRGFLRTFLVDNFTDGKMLKSIMDKILPGNTRKPTIITSKFFDKVHDTSPRETKDSLFRMLTFTSPVVANCLIDNNHIETIMLIENKEEAMHLMQNSSSVPQNCHFSLTIDGTQVYPSPSYRIYSLQSPCEPVLLQSDVTVAVNNLKYEKKGLEQKIIMLDKEFENMKKSKLKNEQILNKTQSETRLIKTKFDECSKKINELKAKCEEEQDDRMVTLTNEINNVNQKIDNLTKLKEDAMKPIPMYETEIKELNKKFMEIKLVIDNTVRSTISEQIENLQREIDSFETDITQMNNSSTELKQKIVDLIKKSEIEKKNIESEVKHATIICSKKIETARNEDEIKRDIEEANRKYDLLQRELAKKGTDYLVLRDEFKKKKEEFIENFALYQKIANIYKSNNRSLKLSKKALEFYISSVKCKVQESFNLVLELRKIKGKLEINQREESMVITMFDNISTSCASGGERTFATVALILALWSNMELPFYSIDEYDVYMDNVNRLATTQLLMMVIENRKNQFIFLTPQDISHIKSDRYVKIVKLKEPRS